jgi:uncharacterized protein (TIGR03083 family)
MDPIEQLRIEGEALLAAARTAGLDATIEHCPGWEMQRLVSHTAKVMQRTAVVVTEGLMEPPGNDRFTQFAKDDAVFDQFAEVLDDLVDALGNAVPNAPSWNFTGENLTNSFWVRRMLNEVAVHRWDAQNASGGAEGFAPELAVDIIDELLFVLMPVLSAKKNPELSATFHFHCTDTEGEWLTAFTAGSPTTTREHAKGQLAVRGPASALCLWAWNRLPAAEGGLEALGDTSLLEAWATVVP